MSMSLPTLQPEPDETQIQFIMKLNGSESNFRSPGLVAIEWLNSPHFPTIHP